MISSPSRHTPSRSEHARFLAVAPAVASFARRRFAYLPQVDREEAVAEAVAISFLLYLSLRRRGRIEQMHTAGFIVNSVRAVANGRCVGNRQCATDVMSRLGRRRHGRLVMSLDADAAADDDRDGRPWLHEVIAERRLPIPDEVALRLDGGRWLANLPTRDQAMVRLLASGESPVEVAHRFGLSTARISQLRSRWRCQWQRCVEAVAA